MTFGDVRVVDAAGAILAHTVRSGSFTYKKGRRLTPEDCHILSQAGISTITVARMGEDDLHEDDAAAQLANALCGQGLGISAAFTGRCNILAKEPGLIKIDAGLIDKINAVDEAITIATIHNLVMAESGQIIATVKIIPFAVSTKTMDQIIGLLTTQSLPISLLEFHNRTAVIINTTLPSLKEKVLEKTTEITKLRLASVKIFVSQVLTCAHRKADVANTIKIAKSLEPDLIIIVGASVTVDREDVVPSGIVDAGGCIIHFGMPVDPGNLMLLSECEICPVMVLPGCARSPKLNGIDFILQRFAAGMDINKSDIVAMGVGGLLIDIPVRPLPRDEAVFPKHGHSNIVNIGIMILAAGQSRRMGPTNKLLALVDEKPLIRRTVETALASKAVTVVVVTGHQSVDINQALEQLPYQEVYNPKHADGLSGSLKAGIAALPENIDGVVVVLGDMPEIDPHHIDALIAGFNPSAGRAIGVPVHNGERGNPVLWSRRFFQGMTDIRGDVGARHLIGENENLVYEVEFSDTAVLTDLDTPEAWARYRASRLS